MKTKKSSPSDALAGSDTGVPERRRHFRLPARGEITFHPNQRDAVQLKRGEFIEISVGGFRISHHDSDLRVGQELLANYGFGDLLVRVIWRHIFEDRVETGFAIAVPYDRAASGATMTKTAAANRG